MVATICLSLLVVIIVLAFSGSLLTLSASGQRFLDSLGLLGGCVNCLGDYYVLAPREISFYLSYAFVLFAELAFLILCGITGIILGHRLSKNLTLISGVVIYLLGSTLIVGIFLLLTQFDPEIHKLFSGVPLNSPGYSPTLNYVSRAIVYISLIYSALSITLYFTAQRLMKHGIDLD